MEMVARTYCARGKRNQNGGSVTEYEYGPYGAPYGNTTPLIFALHPYESGMGFYHAPNRNYSPASARWTTPDPLGMIDGPNVYGYVKGNPANHVDYFGLLTEEECYRRDENCREGCDFLADLLGGGPFSWPPYLGCLAECRVRLAACLAYVKLERAICDLRDFFTPPYSPPDYYPMNSIEIPWFTI